MNDNIEDSKLVKKSKNIKNLYLDPNNYRFKDNDKYLNVNEESVMDTRVQRAARFFIEGKSRENIRDLIASLKTNGFLEVDVIQVKDLGDNNYKVLEGNRRVAALKCLQEDYENGLSIGKLEPSIFKSVPFEIHDFDDNERHLILMGLKHISGNKKWATYNQATLIYDYLKPYHPPSTDSYKEKEDQLVSSLGITKHKLRAMLRVYNLILQYLESDYSDQFDSSKYGLFEEIIKKPVIKSWLDWDDEGYCAKNKANLDRIFSWISKTEKRNDTEESLDDFNEPYEELDPIITKSLEMRDLALFIDNEYAIGVMEEEQSLARGLMASGTKDKQNYTQTLAKIRDNISSLKGFQSLMSTDDVEQLQEVKEELGQLLPTKHRINIEDGNHAIAFGYNLDNHFENLTITSYKALSGLMINDLNKINIFAGLNNTGKTTLLEAVYLLSIQNDVSSFFKLLSLRSKVKSINPTWLNHTFNRQININGKFNKTDVSFSMKKYEASDIDKREDYLTSYKIESAIGDENFVNDLHTYLYSGVVRKNDKVVRLCNASFKSPYFFDSDEVVDEYAYAVSNKKERKTIIKHIVEFLSEIEPSVVDIRFLEQDDIFRFIVETDTQGTDLDITAYGEGIQRIWSIALSIASCRNGILCIDEFETAIHYSLLLKFTKYVQKLAEIFNVQLFLTSHSKECIDAFVLNGYSNDSITGYLLEKKGKELHAKKVKGDRLEKLVNSIDLDIRGAVSE